MLTVYDLNGATLTRREGMCECNESTVWIDMLEPTPEEDAFVERQLGISIPTRAETREIEASNRLYQETGAYFMTAFVVYNVQAPNPATSTLTFILLGNRLVTVRYATMRSFPLFLNRVEKGDLPCNSAANIMIGLVESIVHRAADLIERIQDEVEKLAREVFTVNGKAINNNTALGISLKTIGKEGDLTSRAQESAFSLDRVLTYYLHAARERKEEPQILMRIESAQRDVNSLMEHTRFLSYRINFLLDATLGMINIEQNSIIKIFSVASVALMPPTLIASIYGMNFKNMPELDWIFGYPMAIGLMVISAVVPFVYFRRKGWF